jgi:hypothetical protein
MRELFLLHVPQLSSRSRLREVDFQFEGHELRGLEQNFETASRWAQLARKGKKVMQFLQQRRYIAVVVRQCPHACARIWVSVLIRRTRLLRTPRPDQGPRNESLAPGI